MPTGGRGVECQLTFHCAVALSLPILSKCVCHDFETDYILAYTAVDLQSLLFAILDQTLLMRSLSKRFPDYEMLS